MLAEGVVLDREELGKLLFPNLGVAVVPAGNGSVELLMSPVIDCGCIIGPVISARMDGIQAEIVTGEHFIKCNPRTCPESDGCPLRR